MDYHSFFIDLLQNSVKPPLRLYRVHYSDSMTRFGASGLVAAARPFDCRDKSFQDTVRHHFDWRNHSRSPFISLFDNKSHAMAWGQNLARPRMHRGGMIHLLEISPANSHRPVITIHPVEMSPAPEVPRRAARSALNEYLAFYNVPSNCIRVIASIKLRGSSVQWIWSDSATEEHAAQVTATHDLATVNEPGSSAKAAVPRRWRSRDRTFTGEQVVAWLFALSLIYAMIFIQYIALV